MGREPLPPLLLSRVLPPSPFSERGGRDLCSWLTELRSVALYLAAGLHRSRSGRGRVQTSLPPPDSPHCLGLSRGSPFFPSTPPGAPPRDACECSASSASAPSTGPGSLPRTPPNRAASQLPARVDPWTHKPSSRFLVTGAQSVLAAFLAGAAEVRHGYPAASRGPRRGTPVRRKGQKPNIPGLSPRKCRGREEGYGLGVCSSTR